MEPNNKFIKIRKDKNLSQVEFAELLGVSQGTIGDIERGRIGVSKNVKSKIIEKLNIEAGYFDNENAEKNIELKQRSEAGGNQGNDQFFQDKLKKDRRKWSYVYKFRQYIKDNYFDLDEIGNDLMIIHLMTELLIELDQTKLGRPLFFAIENLQNINTFKDLKTIGLEAYREALPYKDIIHQYAEASRVFIKQLNEIKDEIGLDFDINDYS